MNPLSFLRAQFSPPTVTVPSIDANELGKHNRSGDAWVAVDGIVYDVSEYEKHHPGGAVLFQNTGRDVTDDFRAIHSGFAVKVLKGLPKMATLKPPPMGKVAH